MDLLKWHKYNKECSHPNEYELTPYLVEDKKAPVVIIAPGGGYRMVAAFIEGHPVAKYFQSQGVNAFVLRYRVKGSAHYPGPLEDIAHALKDVQNIYGLSLDNYALCGFSAGGHMSALFGTKEYGYGRYHLPKPNALFLVYPVISLDKKITHLGTRKWFSDHEKDQKALEIGEITHHITSDYPKTFVWRGTNDNSVPCINSDMLIDSLIKNHVDCKYQKYYKAQHGIGLAYSTNAGVWAPQAVSYWLNR